MKFLEIIFLFYTLIIKYKYHYFVYYLHIVNILNIKKKLIKYMHTK